MADYSDNYLNSGDTDYVEKLQDFMDEVQVDVTAVESDVSTLQSDVSNAETNITKLQNIPITIDATTSRVLALSDAQTYIRMTSSSANDVTVPPNSSVAFPTGSNITIYQAGTGKTTIVEGSGVTINTPDTLSILQQYSAIQLLKVATDTWDLLGATGG